MMLTALFPISTFSVFVLEITNLIVMNMGREKRKPLYDSEKIMNKI